MCRVCMKQYLLSICSSFEEIVMESNAGTLQSDDSQVTLALPHGEEAADSGSEPEGDCILEEEQESMICRSPCCDVEAAVSGKPYQTKAPQIISATKRIQGGKHRQFLVEWYKLYPWLVLCTSSSKSFCYLCKYCSDKGYLLDKYADKAFVSSGFNNWKKAHQRFKQHEQSSSHKESVMKVQQMKNPGITAQLDKKLKEGQKVHRKMFMKQLSSLRYLLRQGLALRGHEPIEGNLMQLLVLRSEDSTELKQWIKEKHYLSPEIMLRL